MIPRLLEGRLLRGPNIHHGFTVFVMGVDPGLLVGARTTDAGPDFAARYLDRFAGVQCPPDARLLDVLLAAILGVERFVASIMGRPDRPAFGGVVSTQRGVELVWEARAAWISRAAARVALAGLLELLPAHLGGAGATAHAFDRGIAKLIRQARRRQWTPAAAALAKAATERRLPHELLAGSYVRLGEGGRQQVVSDAMVGEEGADELLDRLFPFGIHATIPIVLVMGERGTGFVARSLDRWLRASRAGVGLTTKRRITIQGSPMDPTSMGRRKGPASLLGDPRLETVIGAVSPRSILARGLDVDHVDVAVLADPVQGGNPAAYEAALRILFGSRPEFVVVHAHNPLAKGVIRAVKFPEQVLLVASRPSDLTNAHADAGGFAVHLAGRTPAGLVELRRGSEAVGAMPMVWPQASPRANASAKVLGRALLAAGAAFAVDLREASPTSALRLSDAAYSRLSAAAGR